MLLVKSVILLGFNYVSLVCVLPPPSLSKQSYVLFVLAGRECTIVLLTIHCTARQVRIHCMLFQKLKKTSCVWSVLSSGTSWASLLRLGYALRYSSVQVILHSCHFQNSEIFSDRVLGSPPIVIQYVLPICLVIFNSSEVIFKIDLGSTGFNILVFVS